MIIAVLALAAGAIALLGAMGAGSDQLSGALLVIGAGVALVLTRSSRR
jgi:hypothetical protein